MIVVSDTSPLTALLTVNESEILPQLFSEVIVPRAVWEELQRGHEAHAAGTIGQTFGFVAHLGREQQSGADMRARFAAGSPRRLPPRMEGSSSVAACRMAAIGQGFA
jgi:hypothetical protein